MRYFIAALLLLLLAFNLKPSFADGAQEDFRNHMLEWREKSELAQSNLREAEDELKTGSASSRDMPVSLVLRPIKHLSKPNKSMILKRSLKT